MISESQKAHSTEARHTPQESCRATLEIAAPVLRSIAGIGSLVLGSEVVNATKPLGTALMVAGALVLHDQQAVFRRKVQQYLGNEKS